MEDIGHRRRKRRFSFHRLGFSGSEARAMSGKACYGQTGFFVGHREEPKNIEHDPFPLKWIMLSKRQCQGAIYGS
jgi:hypothetical protein